MIFVNTVLYEDLAYVYIGYDIYLKAMQIILEHLTKIASPGVCQMSCCFAILGIAIMTYIVKIEKLI